MKRAFVIALAIHLCVLLGAGYIYVLPPEKREKLFEMVKIKAPPKPTARKVRIAPPKKIRKPVPMRPVRRRTAKPIQLIAAKTDIVPEFTISLPEASQAVYTPEVALVRLPEPVVAETGIGSFWDKEIEMKEKEIELESFGLENLQPVGTEENPVTGIVFQVTHVGCAYTNEVGLFYPEKRRLAGHLTGNMGAQEQILLPPYPVPPENFIWYLLIERGFERPTMLLSTDPVQCRIAPVGPNTYEYNWEDQPGGGDHSFNNVVFNVTYMGAQGM